MTTVSANIGDASYSLTSGAELRPGSVQTVASFKGGCQVQGECFEKICSNSFKLCSFSVVFSIIAALITATVILSIQFFHGPRRVNALLEPRSGERAVHDPGRQERPRRGVLGARALRRPAPHDVRPDRELRRDLHHRRR